MDEFVGVFERNLSTIEYKLITSSSSQLERSRKKRRLDKAEVEDTIVKVNLNSSFLSLVVFLTLCSFAPYLEPTQGTFSKPTKPTLISIPT